MIIQFQNMRERAISGGFDNRPPAAHAVIQRELLIPARAPLKSADIRETLLDIAFVIGAFLTASVTALGFVWSMFLLFFVDLH